MQTTACTHAAFVCVFLCVLCYQGHLHAVWALLHAGFPTTDIDEVGNYALRLGWSDGHTTGNGPLERHATMRVT